MIEAWFDGCCEPVNPGGHASFGCVIQRDGRHVFGKGEYVGHGVGMSNNVAEYSGLACVLTQLLEYPDLAGQHVIIHGDSKLAIKQMSGEWNVNGGLYMPYYKIAVELEERLAAAGVKVSYRWVPRNRNEECDALSKKVLTDRGVKLRIQAVA
jgi:ribonuclease HI